jgi:hypothetical protein
MAFPKRCDSEYDTRHTQLSEQICPKNIQRDTLQKSFSGWHTSSTSRDDEAGVAIATPTLEAALTPRQPSCRDTRQRSWEDDPMMRERPSSEAIPSSRILMTSGTIATLRRPESVYSSPVMPLSFHTQQQQMAMSPLWVPDKCCTACSSCSRSFTMMRRRTHCRGCGRCY